MTKRVSKTFRYIVLFAVVIALAACNSVESAQPLENSQPEPSLSPRDVVEIQLLALGNNGESDDGIEIAFRFASPANRSMTGPIERFTSMIKSGIYQIMLDYSRAEYADTVVRGDRAVQRVALYQGDDIVVFDFILERQDSAPYEDCWMTSGVVFVGTGRSAEQTQTI